MTPCTSLLVAELGSADCAIWYTGFSLDGRVFMVIHFYIPVAGWSGFKNSVMAAWFHDREPSLTRHRNSGVDGFEFASFARTYQEDIDHVVSLFPADSVMFVI